MHSTWNNNLQRYVNNKSLLWNECKCNQTIQCALIQWPFRVAFALLANGRPLVNILICLPLTCTFTSTLTVTSFSYQGQCYFYFMMSKIACAVVYGTQSISQHLLGHQVPRYLSSRLLRTILHLASFVCQLPMTCTSEPLSVKPQVHPHPDQENAGVPALTVLLPQFAMQSFILSAFSGDSISTSRCASTFIQAQLLTSFLLSSYVKWSHN